MSEPEVITVEDVTYSYDGRPAVEDVSLSIEEGEFLGLVGPNGSGKTTLLKLMLGLLSPDSGEIRLFGVPVEAFDAGERIGYVSQHSTGKERTMPITVREVVTMGRYPHTRFGWLRSHDREMVEEALERVGIADLADRWINELSGGQKQRAFIARTLAGEADLLALDEPTVGVDADSRDAFYDLLDELNDRGITVVLIEHDIGVVTDHADRIACINRELYHHGDAEGFLESDALARAYGTNSRLLEHGH
ncbi:metal ABC transporter ATP-binding protein [Halalkalicoccus sp. NIPERK01]|uniref:metal ABC transporter ATP-binding protein n=1 Tax=Halalkalicoccus sp. NIPERK01 TaxID=3053469 RepID=UPI00256F35D2|nr:metal ABC transporter ATP-binding protein [Halalkalicoccus sp. NIPERK01]